MQNELSTKFWESIEKLECLSLDDVADIIEENKQRSVPFPENMLLKLIQQRDQKALAVVETEKKELEKKHLLSERYEKGDFFIADAADLPYFRDDMASMENPLFALKPGDVRVIEYVSNSKGEVLKTTIRPAVDIGRATIFDKDIWIFAISKLMQAKFEGKEINNAVEFSAEEFFQVTNRGRGGNQFVMFKEALNRLQGTNIETEIETGGQKSASGFGLLDGWEVTEESNKKLPLRVIVELPNWLYRSVVSDEVLPISKEYFRLKKPIDRRIYEIARKYCGRQESWKIGLESLHQKTGATMVITRFRFAINSLVQANVLPDYIIEYDRKSDMVTFINRDESGQDGFNKQDIRNLISKISTTKTMN
mgnify:FL=1